MRCILHLLGIMSLYCSFTACLASHLESPIENRIEKEDKIPSHYFAIAFYKPSYILPYYYTGTPDNTVYQGSIPDSQQLTHSEMKYQLSFKVPIWKNILKRPTSLYLAYTQQSYWQLYNNSAFFRATDYEPELFFANEIKFHLIKNWNINFLNVGITHQSNGYGGALERSWNRAYLEAISSTENWIINLKPWCILSKNDNNRDINKFLGHAQLLIGYKYNNQVFSLTTRNFLESGGKRGAAELAWSFPLTSHIKGYLQLFSGYGQSLIEYNHRTNSAGVGIALSDWV